LNGKAGILVRKGGDLLPRPAPQHQSSDPCTTLTQGAFIGQHGSWNRTPKSGYRVIFVPFLDGHPAGKPVEVLTGFLNGAGQAQGRPVGVALDQKGALLVADDVGNTVWKVTGL